VPLLVAAASCAASAAATVCSRSSRPQLQLVGVELLRAPAEPAALQLPDQEPQLLDLGLRYVVPLTNEITFGASGIPLGQDSIVLGLQGCE